MKVEATEAYKERLRQWVTQELGHPGMSTRKLAERLGLTYGAIQHWQNKKVKTQLSLPSLKAIAVYRRQSVEEVRAWLEGREPRASSAEDGIDWVEEIRGLKRSVERLQHEVSALEVVAVRSIADLIHCYLVREGIPYEQFEMMVLSRFPGGYDRERLRQIASGQIPPSQINEDDLDAVGSTVTKRDGSMYFVRELKGIRDQLPQWQNHCNCEAEDKIQTQ